MDKVWIAFFSQTGSEIVQLSEHLGRWPDFVFTNNLNRDTWHPELLTDENTLVLTGTHQELMDGIRSNDHLAETAIITLHGYLRIIDPDVCEKYEIYNGHPAPIHLYPDLKGLNKQEDLFDYQDKYAFIGCVIHKVTPILDDGKIVVALDAPNELMSASESYTAVKPLSLHSWQIFFDKYPDFDYNTNDI